jgi:hypothetical protein
MQRGEMIANLLGLKKSKSNGRYDTNEGDKTALGLFRTIERIINDGE